MMKLRITFPANMTCKRGEIPNEPLDPFVEMVGLVEPQRKPKISSGELCSSTDDWQFDAKYGVRSSVHTSTNPQPS